MRAKEKEEVRGGEITLPNSHIDGEREVIIDPGDFDESLYDDLERTFQLSTPITPLSEIQ